MSGQRQVHTLREWLETEGAFLHGTLSGGVFESKRVFEPKVLQRLKPRARDLELQQVDDIEHQNTKGRAGNE